MNELWLIVVVVAAFHVYESLHFVRADCTLLIAGPLGRLRAVDPLHRGLPVGRDRFVVLGPLLPFSRLVIADPWPVHLTGDELALDPPNYVAPRTAIARTPSVPFEEAAEPERVGTRVVLGGEQAFPTSTRASAERWTEAVRDLAATDPERRSERFGELCEESLATDGLAERADELRRQLRLARLAGAATFLFFFGAIPAAQVFGLAAAELLLAYAGLVAVAQVVLWIAHARVHPRARRERLVRALTLPFAPAEVMGAAVELELDELGTRHPLATVTALGSTPDRDRLARRTFLGLRHAPSDWTEPTARRVLLAFAEREGLDLEALTAPPEPSDATSRSYCPACEAEFVHAGEERCPDCSIVGLLEFPRAEPLVGSGA